MGSAILSGLIRNRILPPSKVTIYDRLVDRARELARRWKVRVALGDVEVVKAADILILAVKPQDLFDATTGFRNAFTRRHILITILAGTPIAKVRRAVGNKPTIVRAMPNLGASVNEAVTALTGGNQSALRLAERIFAGCGKTLRLPERFFDLVTAISGSGPAYFFLLMERLTHEGVTNGLPEKVARDLAVQTAVGSALLARRSRFSPAELRRQVTSKGGTTAAALEVFEKEGFKEIISRALAAAVRRARELSRMK